MHWISILIFACLNLLVVSVKINEIWGLSNNQDKSQKNDKIESNENWLNLFRTLDVVQEDKSSSVLTSELCQDSLTYSMPVLKSGCHPLSAPFPYFDFSTIQNAQKELCSKNCKNLITMFKQTLQPTCKTDSPIQIQTSVGKYFNLTLNLFTKTISHSRALLCHNCEETYHDRIFDLTTHCFDTPQNITEPIRLVDLTNNSKKICSQSCLSSINLVKTDVAVACEGGSIIDTQITPQLGVKLSARSFSDLFSLLRTEICPLKDVKIHE